MIGPSKALHPAHLPPCFASCPGGVLPAARVLEVGLRAHASHPHLDASAPAGRPMSFLWGPRHTPFAQKQNRASGRKCPILLVSSPPPGSHDRLPYQRRYRERRDSDTYRCEERSPSFGEDCYGSSRSHHRRRSRDREPYRPRKHAHHCHKRRTRSCSSASSVSGGRGVLAGASGPCGFLAFSQAGGSG